MATRMMDAVGNKTGVARVDGVMVDKPVLDRARRILDQVRDEES